MKLKEVKFVKSVAINSEKVFFDEKHEIIFLGRSNVGKSSLMNAIFEKKDLVKTSSMPGKTRTANLFLLNNKYYFTDLP
jgi:GTP-binding protein